MSLKGTAAIALFTALSGTGGLFGGTCQGQSQGSAQKDPQTTAHVDTSIPGVDTSVLTPREKKEWASYVGEFLSQCTDTPVPIAQCVQEKRACSKCVPAAKFILKGVRDGESREQIEKAYKNRFDADKIHNVPIDGSPTRGPDSAPVTIVEFADFECPFCGMMAPQLEKNIGERPQGEVRFAFKFYPLPGHTHAELAARAAIGAWNQGKFWEMHDKLFANREHLEQSDIDSYAKDLGLNIKLLHDDMQAQKTTDRIAADQKLGKDLGLKGTPTIYVNGRDFDPRADLNDWLNLETGTSHTPGRAGPAIAPAVSAGAAGSAKAPSTLDAGKQK